MTQKKAIVVGNGAIGLTTALLAIEAGYQVTIYYPVEPTTSMLAAASFKPAHVAANAQARQMLELSHDRFEHIAAMYPYQEAGVRKHHHIEAWNDRPRELAWYLDVMEEVRELESPRIREVYEFGWEYRTFFIETPTFLPWLAGRFLSAGGSFLLLDERFTSLEWLARLKADVIFNCTGLGARELCNDLSVIPIKGQAALIDPLPEMDWSISAEGFYIYPRQKDAVIGGTTEPGVWDETVDPATIAQIVRGNQRIIPGLHTGLIRYAYAGLRPYREGGIRLEVENVNGKPIVHNYGHGGAGLTLCWGSAQFAVQLAAEVLT